LKPLLLTLKYGRHASTRRALRKVTAFCMDMWQAYEATTEGDALNARIVHGHFHISKYLSDERNEGLEALRKSTLATGRASSLNRSFRYVWQDTAAVGCRAFFDSWYASAIHSRLNQIRRWPGC
jgi:transposase